MPNIGVKPGLCLKEAALDFRLVVKAAETIKPITERGKGASLKKVSV